MSVSNQRRKLGNAPLVFFSKKVAPAVAAGNTVVLKSSEKAPLTVRPILSPQGVYPGSNNSFAVLENLTMD
jgi:aldehyde dehydrogenase (NAD+)